MFNVQTRVGKSKKLISRESQFVDVMAYVLCMYCTTVGNIFSLTWLPLISHRFSLPSRIHVVFGVCRIKQ